LIWRLWAFVSGTPLGILALWALMPRAGRREVVLAALVGGAAMVALTHVAALRREAHAPDGAGHAMRAATAGWLAWPAVWAVRFEIGPPAWVFAGIAVAWVGFAFWRQTRTVAPSLSPLGHLGRWGLEIALGTALALLVGGSWAAADGGVLEPDERVRAAAWDIDSRVPLGQEPVCSTTPTSVRVLASRGTSPQLSPDGRVVWVEAAGPDGRAQVTRVDLETDTSVCWTCGEPGQNRHPRPHPGGAALLFDTDRYATWRHPGVTEVMVVDTRGESGPAHPARRVTYRDDIDADAFYDPTGSGMVWVRAENGRATVRRAAIQTGHGGVQLTGETDLHRASAGWVVPLAWSADGRALALAHGHGLGPRRGELLDPATGERRSLGNHLGAGIPVAFSRDGSWLALAETSTIRAAALLPEALGFAVARLPRLAGRDPARLMEGTLLRMGPRDGELTAIALPPGVEAWGAPSGLTLSPDARTLVFAQRARNGEERLVWLGLDCH